MEAIFVLVPISLGIVFGAIFVFLWAVKNYQFDDLEKEAERILFEDEGSNSNNQETFKHETINHTNNPNKG
ncbi:MAG: cbb3-type cytochrome oxidase assembly protein CcoS [Pseudomonadales bacterium]